MHETGGVLTVTKGLALYETICFLVTSLSRSQIEPETSSLDQHKLNTIR